MMFRDLRRVGQKLPDKEAKEILSEEKRGVLSLIGDGGYPYGAPLDHWYSEEENALFFHCAKEGHKIDAIEAQDKASYCVIRDDGAEEGSWIRHFRSVIAFGRIRIVEDEEKKREICTRLVRMHTDDEAYLEKELTQSFPRVCCLELKIEHLSGKKVREA